MYIKPTANYKMSKTLKASLALSRFKSAEQRNDWKRAMIQAELAASIVPKSVKQDKGRGRPMTGYVSPEAE